MITRAVCPILIGRETELSRLEDALLAACRGDGNVVVLAGDAGMGKSRLAAELARRARTIRATVMEGACSEAELSLPYLPFLEAIGKHLGSAEVDRIGEQLGPARRVLAQLFPQLGQDSPSQAAEPDGTQAKLRLYEAIVALLELVAAESGLFLVLEDLHWADASTHELLDYLARRVRANPILVLATYRRGEVHRHHPLHPTVQGWLRSGLAAMVELEPLPPDGVARMVSAIFDEPIRDDTRDFFHSRCEGNPFVLEELLKVALDRGDVYRTEAGWERRALADISLPATVRESVLLRLDRMQPAQADVLRVAAVLGRSFDDDLLREVCGQEIEDELEAFADQQLIEEEPGRAGRYRFRHALTQQAIYESLSRRRRERLHGQAAATLRKRPNVPAVDLVQHLLRAKLAGEALPLLLEAAEDADRTHAYREAAELRQRALASTLDPLARARLTGRVGETLELAGDSTRGLGFLDDAIDALHRLGRIAEAEHFRVLRGRSRWAHDRHDLARDDFHRAIDGLEPFGPSRDLALALTWRGGIDVINHRFEVGEPFIHRAIKIADAAGADDVRIWAGNYLGAILSEQFLWDESNATFLRGHEKAVAANLPAIALNSLNNLQANYLFMASPRSAMRISDSFRALRMEMADAHVIQMLSWISTLTGDLEAALKLSHEYVEAAERLGSPRHRWQAQHSLAEMLILLGRYEEARPLLVRPDAGESLQKAIEHSKNWCHYHLAVGDPALAAEAARSVASEPRLLIRSLAFVDAVVHALVANGETAVTESIADAIRAHPLHAAQPQLLLALARIELAAARAPSATELAHRAAVMFGERGDRLDELSARIVAAGGLATIDPDAARRATLACVGDARRMRARYLEAQALELAGALEVEVPAEAVGEPDGVGEKLVTVLFADVRGYTATTARRPPAEMVDMISAFQRWAKREIERQHGMVDKFAGDAVMATFNVSGTTVDHTSHALEAARALGAKAALMDLPVGIGIAVGPAIVGRLAPGANISVVGEATNLAARLQAGAGAGEILISRDAFKRLSGLDLQPEMLTLKGFEEPVTAYRLMPSATRRSTR
jgi:class 3 adenylate cyclase